MERLDGKIAFITGVGGGQGRTAAVMFAAEGALVVGCDLHQNGVAETEQLVQGVGGKMMGSAPVDLGDPAVAAGWIDDGVASAGGIDVLYNNAGAVRFGAITDVPDEDWSFTIRNELDLIFYATRAAWPHLTARGGGSIINVASGAGLQGNMGGGTSAHAAAKGGVISLSRQFAAEGAELGIRSNSICPGVIATPATAPLLEQMTPFVPLGRVGRPEDVVYCALYLASDEASWVTGANFVIDGGTTAVRPTAGKYARSPEA